jgi:hypothetical protein
MLRKGITRHAVMWNGSSHMDRTALTPVPIKAAGIVLINQLLMPGVGLRRHATARLSSSIDARGV